MIKKLLKGYEMNIPIYRAKKIDSDKYVVGYLLPEYKGKFYLSIKWSRDFDGDTPDFEQIDISTLAIHFPDMLDRQGNKIFASLQENGKGGDIMLREYENWYGNNYPKKIYIEKEELITYFDDGLKFIEKINKKQSVFGLTTAKKCKVIGIQE